MIENILAKIPKLTYYIIGIALLAFLFMKFVFPFTAPFVIAVVIAVLIDPLVGLAQTKLKIHRGIAVLMVLILLFGLIIVAGVSALSKVITELQYIQDKATIQGFFNFENLLRSYHSLREYLPDNISQVLEESMQQLNVYITSIVKSILLTTFAIVKDIPKIIIYTVVTFIATFFMSKDKRNIEHALLGMLPTQFHSNFRGIRDGILSGSTGYIRAQAIIVSITTIISIASFLILKTRYVWFLAIVIMILDFIPVIGPSFIFLPWSLWSFISGDLRLGFGFLITYGLIFVTRQVLEPQLIGGRIGVHPLLTLFALFVGIRLFGPIGFVVGPLIVITVRAIMITTEKIPEVIQSTKLKHVEESIEE